MSKISIGIKISISFGIILILLITMGVISYSAINSTEVDQEWVEHTYQVLLELEELGTHLKDAETGQRGFIITGEQRYLEPYNSAITEIKKHRDNIESLTSDNKNQQKRIIEVRSLIEEKLAELEATITLRKTTGFNAAREVVISDQGKKVMDSIRDTLTVMTAEEEKLLDERYTKATETRNRIKLFIVSISLLSIIVVILLSLYLTRRITNPVKKLVLTANQISNGDLSGVLEIVQNDEIGQLADSFKSMQESMQKRADEASQISEGNLTVEVIPLSDRDTMGQSFRVMIENLRRQIGETIEASNIIASSSSQISSTVVQLTSSTSETVTAINQTSTTMKEIGQTVQVADEKAQYVSEIAKKTEESSNNGQQAVIETSNGMNRIYEHMESIAKNIINLSEQSQSIAKIINTVDDIAEQTNLLSVNAAIEAEKAGEQGKGFNVVAQEIKNLADKSKKSTEQIREILEDILKVTGTAVMSTEQGSKAVSEGIVLSQQAGDSIRVLAESIKESANAAFQIVASSREQKTGINQAIQAVENINQASTQNLEGTKQLEISAKSLNDLGIKLNELISWYKI